MKLLGGLKACVAAMIAFNAWSGGALSSTCWNGTDASVILGAGISAATITQEMTLSGGVTCFAVGDAGGADNEFEALTAFSGSDIIAKKNTPGADEGPLPFASIVTIIGGSWDNATTGSFSFSSPASYTSLTMLFKFGGGQTTPSWYAYSLPDTYTGGTWSIANLAGVNKGPNGLSHVTIYAKDAIAPVPLPAAGFLLIGALGGLGIAARRRRKAA